MSRVFASTLPPVTVPNVLLHDFLFAALNERDDVVADDHMCLVDDEACASSAVTSSRGGGGVWRALRPECVPALAAAFARSLRARRFGPEHTLMIALPNCIHYAVVALGALAAGLRVSTVAGASATAAELRAHCAAADATVLVADAADVARIASALGARECTLISVRVSATRGAAGDEDVATAGSCPVIAFDTMFADAAECVHGAVNGAATLPHKHSAVHVTPGGSAARDDVGDGGGDHGADTGGGVAAGLDFGCGVGGADGGDVHSVCLLPFSSGTGGAPKAVRLTHHNVVANLLQFHAINGADIRPNDRYVAYLPFFHIYGLVVILFYSLFARIPLVVMRRRFDVRDVCTVIAKHRVTFFHVVPPMLIRLAKCDAALLADGAHNVRVFFSGASPLADDVAAAIASRFPHAVIRQGYGMTELSPTICMSPPGRERSGAVGIVVPNARVRLALHRPADAVADDGGGGGVVAAPDDDGNGGGGVWELCVQGPNVCAGYASVVTLGDVAGAGGGDVAVANAALRDANGWLHTGDTARIDADGFVYITGRIKELIKYNGWQVSPSECEAVLLQHAAVADAAVVSRADADAGQLPTALLVLATTSTSSEGAAVGATGAAEAGTAAVGTREPATMALQRGEDGAVTICAVDARTAAMVADVLRHYNDAVSSHKRLRGGVFITHTVPRSNAGKILRRDAQATLDAALAAAGDTATATTTNV